MALDSYANLQTSVAGWLNRDDLTANIPDFVTLCEAQLRRELRDRRAIVRANAGFDQEYEDLPDDFAEMETLALYGSPPIPLDYVTPAHFIELANSDTPGQPIRFTIIGNQIRLSPPPGQSYTAEMQYWADFVSLSNSNTTNWLLQRHPGAYLYGTLTQSAPFLRDDDRIAMWAQFYTTEITSINKATQRATHSAGPLRMRSNIGAGDTRRNFR